VKKRRQATGTGPGHARTTPPPRTRRNPLPGGTDRRGAAAGVSGYAPAAFTPGTTPDDIDANATEPIGVTGCPPDRINDPGDRIALAPPQSNVKAEWTTPPGTFDQPGTYLVICTTRVHFLFAGMYGWVIVK
jgi:hypothetical protein